jgi:hypothetical protein
MDKVREKQMKDFGVYMKAQYETWRSAQVAYGMPTRETSYAAFARYLTLTKNDVHQYVTGQRIADPENLERIAGVLGPEVYKITGRAIPVPDEPQAETLMLEWPRLTQAEKDQIVKIAMEMAEAREVVSPAVAIPA